MPLVEYFLGEVYKLKGFLIQIKIKITNKGPGLPTAIKQVAYIGLFLTKKVLKWFKPYLTECYGVSTSGDNIQQSKYY